MSKAAERLQRVEHERREAKARNNERIRLCARLNTVATTLADLSESMEALAKDKKGLRTLKTLKGLQDRVSGTWAVVRGQLEREE